MNPPIIAIDFDGTITINSTYPNKPTKNDLAYHVVEVINLLHSLGCITILWTCRTDKCLDDAIDYCRENNIPIDYVNENCESIQHEFGKSQSKKVFANYYIDDRSIHTVDTLINWDNIKEIILNDSYFNSNHKLLEETMWTSLIKNGK